MGVNEVNSVQMFWCMIMEFSGPFWMCQSRHKQNEKSKSSQTEGKFNYNSKIYEENNSTCKKAIAKITAAMLGCCGRMLVQLDGC